MKTLRMSRRQRELCSRFGILPSRKSSPRWRSHRWLGIRNIEISSLLGLVLVSTPDHLTIVLIFSDQMTLRTMIGLEWSVFTPWRIPPTRSTSAGPHTGWWAWTFTRVTLTWSPRASRMEMWPSSTFRRTPANQVIRSDLLILTTWLMTHDKS